MKNRRLLAVLLGLCLVLLSAASVSADSPTDRIRQYTVTADVNEDATVDLVYHFEWEVLESDGIGPVEWLKIGLPGSHVEEMEALSDNIREVSHMYSGGDYARIDFTDKYYEGEIISFDFRVVMDYMYEMNALEDGYTVYYFTPGWFDEIDVDELVVRWNNEGLTSWTGDCLIIGGYNTWTTKLPMGDIFSVELTYPNDAFGFVPEKSYFAEQGGDWDDDWGEWGDTGYNDYSSTGESIGSAVGGFFVLFIIFMVLRGLFRGSYRSSSGFGGASASGTKDVIKRTKVVYYSKCPGCGAARKEGEQNCSYCGHSFIQSEEVITEEHPKDEDKEALKYKTNGEYAYGSSPNTYVRVNVVHVPVVTHSSSRSSGSSRSGGGRSSGGGCAHSSCACACASCACACACACASGGRAGCSSKDFYNTGLKLEQLKRRKK